jgi:hypothetical protein
VFRRAASVIAVGVLTALALAMPAGAHAVHAAPEPTSPPPSTQAPPPTVAPAGNSLVPIPAGCPVPEPAAVAFVGTMVGKDDVSQTVRFRIDQLRAGTGQPWAIDGYIDVRYGDDYRFLDEDQQYLVGAGFDATYGALASKVRPAEPTFGGNDVVGVDDVSLDCPAVDDPVRTLDVDGSDVDSGVFSLLTDDRRLLLATLAVPTAIAFAALLALVVLKTFGVLAAKGMLQLGRAAVTPVPDHRVTRVRQHRDVVRPTDGSDADGASGTEASATEASTDRATDAGEPDASTATDASRSADGPAHLVERS